MRWNDPALGRVISPDPLGFVDGPNRYAYCAGDPANFVDPWGLCGGPSVPESVWPGELRNPRSWFAANDLTNNLGSAYVNPESWLSRELADTNARMVAFWLGEQAAQATVSRAFGALSRVPGFGWLGRVTGQAADDAAAAAGRRPTTVVSDVTVVSRGRAVGRGDVCVRPTLEGIESGRIGPRDVFVNREGLLPSRPPGYYHEFFHPTPGMSGPGPQRIVRGAGGELYYTPDHYRSFVPLNGGTGSP